MDLKGIVSDPLHRRPRSVEDVSSQVQLAEEGVAMVREAVGVVVAVLVALGCQRGSASDDAGSIGPTPEPASSLKDNMRSAQDLADYKTCYNRCVAASDSCIKTMCSARGQELARRVGGPLLPTKDPDLDCVTACQFTLQACIRPCVFKGVN